GLCGVTHGLVGLGVVLPQQWVRKLLDAAWQRMRLSGAQQVPGRRGGPGYAGRLAARDCLDVTSLVKLLWALVKASHAPPRAWLAGCLVQVEAEVGELTAADVAQLMWCLAQMQVRPSLPLLAQLMARGYATLQELPPEGLVALVWALGQLGARPSAVWAERALKSVYRLAPSMGCWGCCSLLWSLGLLQLRPSLKLVTALLAAARQQLEEAASRGEGGPGTSLVGGAGAGNSGVQASRAKQAGRPSRSSAGPDDLYQLTTGLVALKHTTGLPAWLAPALSSLAGQQLHRLPLQQQEQVPAYGHLVCSGCSIMLMFPMGAQTIKCSVCHSVTPAPDSEATSSQPTSSQPPSSQPPTSQPPSSQPPVSQLPVDPAWAEGGRQSEGEAVHGPVPTASPPQSSLCRPSTAVAVDKDQGKLEQ
ncbi:hypothetical protein QJQ45_007110, partial [Haematococcus lacustris]